MHFFVLKRLIWDDITPVVYVWARALAVEERGGEILTSINQREGLSPLEPLWCYYAEGCEWSQTNRIQTKVSEEVKLLS